MCDAVSWLNLDILTQPGSGFFGRLFRFPLSSHWTWDKIATQVPNRLNHLCAWMPLFSRAISRISHGDLATRPDWRHVVSAFPSRVRNDVWIGRRFESSKHLSSSFRRSSQSPLFSFLLRSIRRQVQFCQRSELRDVTCRLPGYNRRAMAVALVDVRNFKI